MKQWGLVTAVLYAVGLVLLTGPVISFAFPKATNPDLIYSAWGYWVWVGFIILCALLLMVVPVRLTRARNPSRRPVALTIGATGLFLSLLVLGATLSIGEVLVHGRALDWLGSDGATAIARLAVTIVGLWVLWAAVLYWLTRRAAPLAAVRRVAWSLLGGSVLELLIAVPSHIIVRGRDECCAGLYTAIGLVTGISVMLLSLGPGVLFLYSERMSRIRQQAKVSEQRAGHVES